MFNILFSNLLRIFLADYDLPKKYVSTHLKVSPQYLGKLSTDTMPSPTKLRAIINLFGLAKEYTQALVWAFNQASKSTSKEINGLWQDFLIDDNAIKQYNSNLSAVLKQTAAKSINKPKQQTLPFTTPS